MNARRWIAGLGLFAFFTLDANAQYGQSPSPEHTFAQGQNTSSNRSANDGASVLQGAQEDAETYKAIQAAADAQAAMYKAQLAALQLKYGGGLTGTERDGAIEFEATYKSQPEALLLVNRSVSQVAADIHSRINPIISSQQCRSLLILTDDSSLSLDASILFDFNVNQITAAIQASNLQFKHASDLDPGDVATDSDSESKGNRSAIQVAGAVTEGLAKLGSYFQSTYKFGQVDMQGFDGSETAYALAGVVASNRSTGACNGKEVLIPERQFIRSLEDINARLSSLDKMYIQALGERAASNARKDALTTAGKTLAASRYTSAIASADKAIELYGAFLTLVMKGPEGKAEAFLVRVVREKQTIKDLDDKKPIVLVVSSKAAGQYYAKKNAWTFFGGPPLYTAAAVTASYMLLDPVSGAVLASGTAGSHGGYQSIRNVQRLIDGERAKAKDQDSQNANR